jgi:two-component system, CitB family, response regulator MalR
LIKVLLVEDDPMVAELNRAYVERVGGFEIVASVQSGSAALEFLRNRSADLILLDIFMAGQSGMDLLTEIRKMSLDIDVILVTAARDTKTIGKALKLGAVDYLIKPFEFERLKQALDNYRETRGMMHKEHPVSQSELDRFIIRHPADSHARDQLPKGLDRITLERLSQIILTRTGEKRWFTCEELSGSVGISRVSVRKYIEFLCSIKVLRMEPVYGGAGRPVHRFTLQDAYRDEFRRFL